MKKWFGKPWFWVTVLWLTYGLYMAGHAHFTAYLTDRPIPVERTLVLELVYTGLWLIVTPPVLFLARRFPIEAPHVVRNVVLHLVAMVVLTTCQKLMYDAVRWGFFGGPPIRQSTILLSVHRNFDWGLPLYWLVATAGHALQFRAKHREERLRAAQAEAQLAQAQLHALKMQIHPHFLFNTLHAISALVHESPHAAERMIVRLSDLLRASLENSGAEEVSLEKELEMLESYLAIQRIRFEDRLSVEMEISPESLQAQVPNLILQPLVENAIKHGIGKSTGAGVISVEAKVEAEQLWLAVRDSGPGLTKPIGNGIGLKNTRARLERLYGASHEFEFGARAKGGVQVCIAIPFRKATTPA